MWHVGTTRSVGTARGKTYRAGYKEQRVGYFEKGLEGEQGKNSDRVGGKHGELLSVSATDTHYFCRPSELEGSRNNKPKGNSRAERVRARAGTKFLAKGVRRKRLGSADDGAI